MQCQGDLGAHPQLLVLKLQAQPGLPLRQFSEPVFVLPQRHTDNHSDRHQQRLRLQEPPGVLSGSSTDQCVCYDGAHYGCIPAPGQPVHHNQM